MWSFTSELEPAFFTLISLYSSYKPIFYKYLRTTFTTMHLPPPFLFKGIAKNQKIVIIKVNVSQGLASCHQEFFDVALQ